MVKDLAEKAVCVVDDGFHTFVGRGEGLHILREELFVEKRNSFPIVLDNSLAVLCYHRCTEKRGHVDKEIVASSCVVQAVHEIEIHI